MQLHTDLLKKIIFNLVASICGRKFFDLTPKEIAGTLELKRAIYKRIAAYGILAEKNLAGR